MSLKLDLSPSEKKVAWDYFKLFDNRVLTRVFEPKGKRERQQNTGENCEYIMRNS